MWARMPQSDFVSILAIALLSLAKSASAIKTHFVFWNSSNPIFRLDNTDHIIDVNEGNLPWEYDQLNLVCPQNSKEQHVIYSVSREEYDGCRVTSPRPKIVAICNKPEQFQYVTITFRNFSPTPGGMEFKPGKSYYLISTSTTRDLHRRVGGYCNTHNMKMVFKVADNSEEPNSVNENVVEKDGSAGEVGDLRRSSPFYSALVPSLTPTPSPSSTPVYYYRARGESKDFTYYYSPRDLVKLRKTILSRSKQQDEENETLKAEKLLSSSSASLSISLALSLSLSLCLLRSFA